VLNRLVSLGVKGKMLWPMKLLDFFLSDLELDLKNIMISNAYETFNFFYDVVLERKKMNRIQFSIIIFLIFKGDFKNL
jgi:hypothetical protein